MQAEVTEVEYAERVLDRQGRARQFALAGASIDEAYALARAEMCQWGHPGSCKRSAATWRMSADPSPWEVRAYCDVHAEMNDSCITIVP